MAIEDSVVARLAKFGDHFEILVEPKAAEAFKAGEPIDDILQILEIDTIFKDARKGDKANDEVLQKSFKTTDVSKIAETILSEGEVQLTTEQRKAMVEKRLQRVVNSIARDAVDPTNDRPHPPERIKNALEQGRFNVDLHKTLENQVQEALKILRPIIPIKIERIQVAIRVPADFAPKAYTHLHHYDMRKEEWQKDGSLVAVIEIPAGIQDKLYAELNQFTHGGIETRIIKKE